MDKKMGRPRSEETKNKILSSAYDLLLEKGFKLVTVEGIAQRAGVSKATIYKWWSNKAAVVLDGYFAATEAMNQIPDTGLVKEDIFIQVNNLANFFKSSKGRMITELIGEGQFDSNIADEYRKRYFNPRRLISANIIERGMERGELSKDLDIDLFIDCLYAPIFYRLLITGDTIDNKYIRNIIDYAFKGVK